MMSSSLMLGPIMSTGLQERRGSDSDQTQGQEERLLGPSPPESLAWGPHPAASAHGQHLTPCTCGSLASPASWEPAFPTIDLLFHLSLPSYLEHLLTPGWYGPGPGHSAHSLPAHGSVKRSVRSHTSLPSCYCWTSCLHPFTLQEGNSHGTKSAGS